MLRPCAHYRILHFAAGAGLVLGAGLLDTGPGLAQTVADPGQASAKPKSAKSLGKATAAQPSAGADEAAKDPEKGKRAFEAGIKAYEAGRHDEAVNQLNAAVKAGGLAGPAMAKALYYRGAAFNAKGKHGQAISDLTSALWFKGGLDDKEKADATRIRSEAYVAAGLDPQGNAATASATAPASVVAAPPTGGSWVASPSLSSPQLSAVPAETPAASGGGIDLGNVLGGLFGGLTSGAKPIETAALPGEIAAGPVDTGNAAPATATAKGASPGGEVLPWGAVAEPGRAPNLRPVADGQSGTAGEPAKPETKPEVRAKPSRQAAAAGNAAPKASGTGAYRIQVGTAKSQAEADALAEKARANPTLGGAAVAVDTMAFGGTTFYRVRVGPYATAADTRAPCAALKSGGLDCLVVTQ